MIWTGFTHTHTHTHIYIYIYIYIHIDVSKASSPLVINSEILCLRYNPANTRGWFPFIIVLWQDNTRNKTANNSLASYFPFNFMLNVIIAFQWKIHVLICKYDYPTSISLSKYWFQTTKFHPISKCAYSNLVTSFITANGISQNLTGF